MEEKRRYSQEEISLAIELWQESGLTQIQFCDREKLSAKTFSRWLKKYREKESGKGAGDGPANTFIPVELPGTVDLPPAGAGRIEVTYPSGTRVTCPANIGIQQLKTLAHL